MTVIYWSIPLFLVASAIGVLPVLCGTFKQESWDVASSPQVLTTTVPGELRPGSVAVEHSDSMLTLHQVRTEIVALLERVDRIRDETPNRELTRSI